MTSPVTNQTNTRWGNDDGTVSGAGHHTWVAGSNVPLSGTSRALFTGSNYRLRMQYRESANGNFPNFNPRLEVSYSGTTPSWNVVGSSTDTLGIRITNSTFETDGVLIDLDFIGSNGAGSCAGAADGTATYYDTSNPGGTSHGLKLQFTEDEFSVRNNAAHNGSMFMFRVTDDGTTLTNYQQYAFALGSSLIVSQTYTQNVSDSSTLTETITKRVRATVATSDAITLDESIVEIRRRIRGITVSDMLSLSEDTPKRVRASQLIDEIVTLSENFTRRVAVIVSVEDSLSISEDVQSTRPIVITVKSIEDALSISEVIQTELVKPSTFMDQPLSIALAIYQ